MGGVHGNRAAMRRLAAAAAAGAGGGAGGGQAALAAAPKVAQASPGSIRISKARRKTATTARRSSSNRSSSAASLLLVACIAAGATTWGPLQLARADNQGAPLHYECSPPDAEKVLSIGMHSGHNNQRWCVLAAMAVAARYNYTFVLPSWRLEYHRRQLPTCATRPFEFFYRLEPVQDFAARHGFRIAPNYAALDPEQLGACVQTISSGYGGGARYFNQHLLNGAPLPTTLCLNSKDSVLHLVRLTLPHEVGVRLPPLEDPHVHYLNNPELQEVRKILRPAPLFEAEVDKIVAAIRHKYNASSFYSVHVRVEEDWRKWVAMTDPWIPGRSIWVGEEAVTQALLQEHGVRPGSVLFVCSGTPTDQLRALCSTFRCVDFGAVWRDRHEAITSDLGRESMAFLSFWVAARGDAFYGTIASSFSIEMHETYRLAGKPAHFYNPTCAPGDKEACRGDVPPAPDAAVVAAAP